jgi:RNA polymerase sigma-70 factor (ECF subfamily)
MAYSECLPTQTAASTGLLVGLTRTIRTESLGKAGKMDKALSASKDFDDVRRCLGGDGNAYRRIIERHQGRISAMMWRFSRDPEVHEDLVQDVFVEAYRSLRNYRGEAPFEHWVSRVATHVGYQYWKRQKREQALQTVPLDEWRELADEPADGAGPQEAAELLHKLLEQLPPRDRLVLTLRHIEDHSVEKTAELTGWSQTMVKVQTWRARKKLRALFDQARQEVDS